MVNICACICVGRNSDGSEPLLQLTTGLRRVHTTSSVSHLLEALKLSSRDSSLTSSPGQSRDGNTQSTPAYDDLNLKFGQIQNDNNRINWMNRLALNQKSKNKRAECDNTSELTRSSQSQSPSLSRLELAETSANQKRRFFCKSATYEPTSLLSHAACNCNGELKYCHIHNRVTSRRAFTDSSCIDAFARNRNVDNCGDFNFNSKHQQQQPSNFDFKSKKFIKQEASKGTSGSNWEFDALERLLGNTELDDDEGNDESSFRETASSQRANADAKWRRTVSTKGRFFTSLPANQNDSCSCNARTAGTTSHQQQQRSNGILPSLLSYALGRRSRSEDIG